MKSASEFIFSLSLQLSWWQLREGSFLPDISSASLSITKWRCRVPQEHFAPFCSCSLKPLHKARESHLMCNSTASGQSKGPRGLFPCPVIALLSICYEHCLCWKRSQAYFIGRWINGKPSLITLCQWAENTQKDYFCSHWNPLPTFMNAKLGEQACSFSFYIHPNESQFLLDDPINLLILFLNWKGRVNCHKHLFLLTLAEVQSLLCVRGHLQGLFPWGMWHVVDLPCLSGGWRGEQPARGQMSISVRAYLLLCLLVMYFSFIPW